MGGLSHLLEAEHKRDPVAICVLCRNGVRPRQADDRRPFWDGRDDRKGILLADEDRKTLQSGATVAIGRTNDHRLRSGLREIRHVNDRSREKAYA